METQDKANLVAAATNAAREEGIINFNRWKNRGGMRKIENELAANLEETFFQEIKRKFRNMFR